MPRFAGCLIGFHSRLVVNPAVLKCGKDKLIEAFEFAVSLQLWFFRAQNLFLLLKVCIQWLLESWLKHSDICGS